jgi:hypothetical protein
MEEKLAPIILKKHFVTDYQQLSGILNAIQYRIIGMNMRINS